jgi:hypothetical protein
VELGALTAADVVPGSGKIAWWVCPSGHEYDAPMHERVGGAGCPYCSGKRAGQGTQLAALRPDLVGVSCAQQRGHWS